MGSISSSLLRRVLRCLNLFRKTTVLFLTCVCKMRQKGQQAAIPCWVGLALLCAAVRQWPLRMQAWEPLLCTCLGQAACRATASSQVRHVPVFNFYFSGMNVSLKSLGISQGSGRNGNLLKANCSQSKEHYKLLHCLNYIYYFKQYGLALLTSQLI